AVRVRTNGRLSPRSSSCIPRPAEEPIVLHHCNADTRNRYWGDYLNFQCCIWRAAAASALRESRPNRRTERGQRAGRENAIRGPEFRGYPHTESLPAWTGRI